MPSIAPRVRPRLLACAAVLLSLSAPALAQRVVEGDLQQQMSPSEFKPPAWTSSVPVNWPRSTAGCRARSRRPPPRPSPQRAKKAARK